MLLTAVDEADPQWSATAPDPGDPGHLIPADEWATVVAAADERAATLQLPATLRSAPDRTVTARSHGGVISGGPRVGVVHSAETPLAAGYAWAIARYFRDTASTSATVMVDPAETIRLLPDNVVAYHCGPNANGFTIGAEQAGYARLTRAEWTTPAGLAQMRELAQYMREVRDQWGIPLRWCTDDELRRARTDPGFRPGWCFHDTIRRVLGGTTHYDPMPNYPAGDLMALANGEVTEMELAELYAAKGVDGRNLWDGIIQTRNELRDRAREGVVDALFATRIDGRNLYDWMIQLRADTAAADARDAARDAALLEFVKQLQVGTGTVDPAAIAGAAQEGAERALVAKGFPTVDQLAAAVIGAQERAELERLRERVAQLEAEQGEARTQLTELRTAALQVTAERADR